MDVNFKLFYSYWRVRHWAGFRCGGDVIWPTYRLCGKQEDVYPKHIIRHQRWSVRCFTVRWPTKDSIDCHGMPGKFLHDFGSQRKWWQYCHYPSSPGTRKSNNQLPGSKHDQRWRHQWDSWHVWCDASSRISSWSNGVKGEFHRVHRGHIRVKPRLRADRDVMSDIGGQLWQWGIVRPILQRLQQSGQHKLSST